MAKDSTKLATTAQALQDWRTAEQTAAAARRGKAAAEVAAQAATEALRAAEATAAAARTALAAAMLAEQSATKTAAAAKMTALAATTGSADADAESEIADVAEGIAHQGYDDTVGRAKGGRPKGR
jgi:hypothetical protein